MVGDWGFALIRSGGRLFPHGKPQRSTAGRGDVQHRSKQLCKGAAVAASTGLVGGDGQDEHPGRAEVEVQGAL